MLIVHTLRFKKFTCMYVRTALSKKIFINQIYQPIFSRILIPVRCGFERLWVSLSTWQIEQH